MRRKFPGEDYILSHSEEEENSIQKLNVTELQARLPLPLKVSCVGGQKKLHLGYCSKRTEDL